MPVKQGRFQHFPLYEKEESNLPFPSTQRIQPSILFEKKGFNRFLLYKQTKATPHYPLKREAFNFSFLFPRKPPFPPQKRKESKPLGEPPHSNLAPREVPGAAKRWRAGCE